ncbi:MAG: DUF1849 family protein [Hyphomicrobiaceae bacterium]|nr:DUF1849 family protein [Hyphomicrobiaceae bacterium]
MIIGSRSLAAWLLALITAGYMPAAAAESSGLVPHRAVYDITLVEARPGSGISELTGRMVYELTGSECAGYTQNMRFVTRSTNQEGEASISDLRSSSSEDVPGDRFRFSNSQYRNDRHVEQTVGEAVRRRNAGEIRVELTKPKKRVIKLSDDAMFPIQHSGRLLAAARDGLTVFSTDLFDASEKGEKVYATSAFIGARHEPGYNKSLPAVPGAEPLDALAAWPIALSYYEKGKDLEDAVPSYELAFVLFDNGVSRRILIDYGNFSIRGELKEITFLEPDKCTPVRK